MKAAMVSGNKPEQVRSEGGPLVVLGVIFITLLLLTICALVGSLLSQWRSGRQPPAQSVPVVPIPTAAPIELFTIYLPMAPSGGGAVTGPQTLPEDIWEVIEIRDLGFELNGQRYDLARFRRLGSQETVMAYCLDRGWNQPEIGARYVLGSSDIFVPLAETNGTPLQRFLMIR
jgi:hypothetical protein